MGAGMGVVVGVVADAVVAGLLPPDVPAYDDALVRNLTLAVPLVAVLLAALTRRARDPRVLGAAFLATAWAWCALLVVHGCGLAGHWWRVAPGPTTLLGLPLETSLGWALAWGALPALVSEAGRHGAGAGVGRAGAGSGVAWAVALWLLGLAWVDALLMPRLRPLVLLEAGWWRGEVVVLAVVAAPALLLALTTGRDRLLAARVVLQVALFTALVLWLLPTVVLDRTGGSWETALDHGLAARTALLVAAVVGGVPALSAVVELARVGRGTPFPWDPPARLVTTGPYAYVANPMQLGACTLLLVLAAATHSWWLVAATGGATVFSQVLAERHEQATMARRWPEHAAYRRAVRAWRPRWRPYVARPADLWIDRTCTVCRATGAAVLRLGPTGLTVRPAAEAPVRLTRARWTSTALPPNPPASPPASPSVVPGDGEPLVERGLAALARAVEQTRLPWAWCGWAVRLPVVVQALGAVVDACGLGPREAGTEPASYGRGVGQRSDRSRR